MEGLATWSIKKFSTSVRNTQRIPIWSQINAGKDEVGATDAFADALEARTEGGGIVVFFLRVCLGIGALCESCDTAHRGEKFIKYGEIA